MIKIIKLRFKNDFSNISRNQKLIISTPKSNGIYIMGFELLLSNNAINLVVQSDKSYLWHKTLGHLGEK